MTKRSAPSKEVLSIIAEGNIEPKMVRRLILHDESDSVFEIHTDVEWESCIRNGCEDVTGVSHFEKLFLEQNKERKDDESLIN